jgi:hypothetical protein
MACILGIIWGAFWGSLASVKLVFRVGKTSSGDCLGVPCQHFVRTCFQRAPRKHFYGFWIRSGFNLGTIFNKLGTLLGFWFRDRKKVNFPVHIWEGPAALGDPPEDFFGS